MLMDLVPHFAAWCLMPYLPLTHRLVLFPRVVPWNDLEVKVPCTPGKGKC